ncbi:UNVERIFIED_CONTAM: [F-actin]-monooxygenase mical3 [Siphonaria sp. JEL0065]|nr:[F-actin]-monooxygenase mical3 [Siphonaria sp. JEL0065]
MLYNKNKPSMMGSTSAEFTAAFEKFITHEEVPDIMEAFAVIKACLPAGQRYSYQALSAYALPLLPYKRKSLLGTFDCKIKASSEFADKMKQEKLVVISGAGPVGLRAAIEAVLVGFKVVVVELRGEFSRHNVIKTWNYTITDLQSVGLSQFYPQFSAHGTGTLHLGIKEIQTCLLKAALLLGVEVQYQVGVCGLVDPVAGLANDNKWSVWTLPASDARLRLKKRAEIDGLATDEVAPELSLQPGEQDLSRLTEKNRVDYFEAAVSQDDVVIRKLQETNAGSQERVLSAVEQQVNLDVRTLQGVVTGESNVALVPFDYLLVAEGESSRLIRHLGFDRKIWRFASMIGIVVNIDISAAGLKSASSLERNLPEFVVTRASATWKQGPLGKLDALGYELENMEYLRSMKTHFFVCTIKKQTLKSSGIVREEKETIKQLLEYSNLDISQLEKFARELGNLAGVPETCPLSRKHGVQIFDFSCKGQCVESVRKLVSCDSAGSSALVLPIGDALQNPYWPQGLGVNRGFHSAFDAIHAIHVDATTQSYETAVYERLTAFRAMEWYPLSERCLEAPVPSAPSIKTGNGAPKEQNWTIDPLTRYNRVVLKGIHMNDVEMNAPSPSLPERFRRFHGFVWGAGAAGENQKQQVEDSVLYPSDDVPALLGRLLVGAAELTEKTVTKHKPLSANF